MLACPPPIHPVHKSPSIHEPTYCPRHPAQSRDSPAVYRVLLLPVRSASLRPPSTAMPCVPSPEAKLPSSPCILQTRLIYGLPALWWRIPANWTAHGCDGRVETARAHPNPLKLLALGRGIPCPGPKPPKYTPPAPLSQASRPRRGRAHHGARRGEVSPGYRGLKGFRSEKVAVYDGLCSGGAPGG